ncbi:helix-turn-helix transcriptional regulator [Rhodococcoides kyotonense]|uniref:Helix-turn-helix n=1 Tax=Rhodococcoides kyotonense TaxID=398843 RepID=A0A239E8I9_9NOCA|nr:helix-turn-helix transcriptional regulator [Rhodococcus kyotonensis]SNS40242.1 Helix-turn-helix [Rhodococcus kyotonensis]
MKIESVVGESVRQARKSAGMRQEEFGAALEPLLGRAWSRQAVSTAEQGGRSFTAVELIAISKVLNTSVSDLFLLPPTVDSIELPTGESIEASRMFELSHGAYAAQDSDEQLDAAIAQLKAAIAHTAAVTASATASSESLDEAWAKLNALKVTKFLFKPTPARDEE